MFQESENIRHQTSNTEADDLPGYSWRAQQPYVVYEIHLHPTYQIPVLWFSLHDLSPCDSSFDIETVYRYLVPDQYKDHLRSIGVVGGISAAASYPLFVMQDSNMTTIDMRTGQDLTSSSEPPNHRPPSIFYSPLRDERSHGAI